MTEDEARELLAGFDGLGEFEKWVAGQPWREVQGDWRVMGDLRGTQFEVENDPDRLRIIAWLEGAGPPAAWTVTAEAGRRP